MRDFHLVSKSGNTELIMEEGKDSCATYQNDIDSDL